MATFLFERVGRDIQQGHHIPRFTVEKIVFPE
jgi:hypothetical protein